MSEKVKLLANKFVILTGGTSRILDEKSFKIHVKEIDNQLIHSLNEMNRIHETTTVIKRSGTGMQILVTEINDDDFISIDLD